MGRGALNPAMTPTCTGSEKPPLDRSGAWKAGYRGGASSLDRVCGADAGTGCGLESTGIASMRLSSARAARESDRATRKIRVMTLIRHGPEGRAQVPYLRVGTHICKHGRGGGAARESRDEGPRSRLWAPGCGSPGETAALAGSAQMRDAFIPSRHSLGSPPP